MWMPSRRWMAFAVVAGLGLSPACQSRSPEAAVPGLIADLKNPDPTVSGKANLELIRLGEPAVPALVEMLKSGDVRIRTLAVTAFWGLGEKGRGAGLRGRGEKGAGRGARPRRHPRRPRGLGAPGRGHGPR